MGLNENDDYKLFGFYRGQVIQHLDAGKCKIFIPGVFPEECLNNPDCIPDAEQAAPLFGGVNNGNGCFSYPNIGAIVWCFFENGDQNFPVYFASTLGGEMAIDSIGYGFKQVRSNINRSTDPKEDTTKNGQDAQQHMIEVGKSRILISEAGQVIIQCQNKTTTMEGDDSNVIITVDSNGMVTIKSSKTLQLQTPQIKFDAEDIQMNATMIKLRATNLLQVDAAQQIVKNDQSHTVTSPQIKMDANNGVFIARGKMGRQIMT